MLLIDQIPSWLWKNVPPKH